MAAGLDPSNDLVSAVVSSIGLVVSAVASSVATVRAVDDYCPLTKVLGVAVSTVAVAGVRTADL